MNGLRSIYDNVVNVVIEVSELDRDRLLKSREEEFVDARAILVNRLVSLGFTEKCIAEFSGMSQQRVNSLKNTFRNRSSKIGVELLLGRINKKLTNILQNEYK